MGRVFPCAKQEVAVADNYWDRARTGRIGRRRAITLAGGTALGAAFLAACGGSDSGGSSGSSGDGKDKSSLITKSEDSTKQAKKGGILKDRTGADAPTMDVHGA